MKVTRCLIVLLIVTAGAGAARGQEVRGYVEKVDATKGTISLHMFSMGNISVKSFNLLKPDIPVVNLAGQAFKLSDVQAEDWVTLKLNSDEDVTSIIVPLPTVSGPLTAVDTKKGELVLKLRTGLRTIAISPDTKILLHGMPAKLKELTVGDVTSVTFTQDQKSIVEVRSGRALGTPPQPLRRQGTLIEVDRDKRLVRFFRSGGPVGDMQVLREVPLAKDATFSLNYQNEPICALKIEEITKGFDTIYWVDPAFNKIVHVDLHMPLLARRKVKTFDRKTGSITITNEDDVESVLTMSPRIKVQRERGAGTLDEIQPGVIVDCGLNPDRKHIVLLVVHTK